MKGKFGKRAYGVLALVMILTLALPWTVLADDISNNLDGTVDADFETLSLNPSGPEGSVILTYIERNNDGKNGCNRLGKVAK